jgi:hypothetical protein
VHIEGSSLALRQLVVQFFQKFFETAVFLVILARSENDVIRGGTIMVQAAPLLGCNKWM